MKKLAAVSSILGFLSLAKSAFAQIQIQPPKLDGQKVGYTDISQFINNAIVLAFIIAVIIVLVMLVWGAIQWIFSGGSKESVEAARNRIIHALVGFAILAVAFAIARVAGQFLGFDIFQPFKIPGPT